MGEGEPPRRSLARVGVGQNRFGLELVPPPLHPLPRWGGEFLLRISKKIRDKFSDFLCKNLRLVRDFARKRWPLRGSRY